MENSLKTVSEQKAEQFTLAVLMAMSKGNRKAVMGGLLILFRHFESGGDLPSTLVTNILDTGQDGLS